jgi:hypothetical protein
MIGTYLLLILELTIKTSNHLHHTETEHTYHRPHQEGHYFICKTECIQLAQSACNSMGGAVFDELIRTAQPVIIQQLFGIAQYDYAHSEQQ